MRAYFATALAAALLVGACGGSADLGSSSGTTSGDGSGGGGTSSSTASGDGSGGGGTGAGASCDDLAVEPGQPVTIRIENQTGASIFIYDECYESGPDGVLVDGSP